MILTLEATQAIQIVMVKRKERKGVKALDLTQKCLVNHQKVLDVREGILMMILQVQMMTGVKGMGGETVGDLQGNPRRGMIARMAVRTMGGTLTCVSRIQMFPNGTGIPIPFCIGFSVATLSPRMDRKLGSSLGKLFPVY